MYPNNRKRPYSGNDFAAPEELVGHSYPHGPVPELDPKDERLLYLADKNGYLVGRNSVLENQIYRVQEQNDKFDVELTDLRKENKRMSERISEYREEDYRQEREIERLKQYAPKEEESEDQE